MYSGDIKLSEYGESIIKNGEFILTEDDSGFIIRMLLTTRGSWSEHLDLGVGLEEFIGERLNDKLMVKIKSRIISFFKLYGLFSQVSIERDVDNDSAVLISMKFFTLDDISTTLVSFNFNIENGGFIFTDEDNDIVENNVNIRETVNKYSRRK